MPVEDISIFLYKITRILLLSLISLIIYYLVHIGNTFVEEDKKIIINRKYILPGILTFAGIVILYKLFTKYSILVDTFYTIIFSIILAYLFNPAVKYFESKGLSRFWGVIIIYLLILGAFIIFAFLIVPRSGREIKKFISNTPIYFNKISRFLDGIISDYDSFVGDLPFGLDGLQNALRDNIAGLESVVVNGIRSFFNGLFDVFARVVSLVLTPILTLYFIVDQEYFLGKIVNLIPKKHLDDSMELFKEIDMVLTEFVRGRLFMAAYVGVAVTIVLLILKVDFAIAIGFITGFADIIPYIGPFLGFLPAVFFALLDSPVKALWVSVLFLLIQWTENNVLAPKVIGESTGLHPMTVLLSILLGGGMFGVIGMILAVPVVSVVIILYNFFNKKIADNKAAH